MKLTITKIYRSDKDKNGNPLVGKNSGKPYEKVSIKCQEYGDKWIGGFGSRDNQSWREGDVVDVEIENNGQYLNFKHIDPIKNLEERVLALEKRINAFNSPTESPEPSQDISPEDIPF